MEAAHAKPARHPHVLNNRRPTPQDMLELSSRIYKSSRKLYNEADAQGMRVYHDELLTGDVRLVMLVPSWFPKAHVALDPSRVQGDRVSVVFVLRGTMQDLVKNTMANLELIYNKLVDDQHLPDTAADATKVIRAWLHTLLLRHPCLDAGADGSAEESQQQQEQEQEQSGQRRLHLDVHIAGHSLGGLLAEVATVESTRYAAGHGMEWTCTSFESPGLPELYFNAALRMAPKEHWDGVITSYLAAPNVINMLYRHLGRIVHVVVPFEQTWSYCAKCVGADVARVTAWAIIGGMMVAGAKHLSVLARRRAEEEATNGAAAAAGQLSLQQCDARLPQLPAAGAAAAGAPAPAALAPSGPSVPEFLIVAATPSSSADAAGGAARRLLSTSFPPGGAGGRGGAGAAAAQQPPALTAAVVGAAAAAGEAAASLGGGRILHGVLRRSGLGALATVLGGWVFGKGGIWGVMECLAGVLGVEVEELIHQHALGPMRQCFDPHTGELKPRYCRKMANWPHLGTRGRVILTAAKQVAKWMVPSFVCRDNVGVANLMSRTALVEARCARLQGYEVLEDTEELQRELGTAAGAAAGEAAPLLDTLLEAAEAEQQQLQQQQHTSLEVAAGADAPGLPPGPAAALPRRLGLFDGGEQQLRHTAHHRHAPVEGAPAPRGLGAGLGLPPHRQRPAAGHATAAGGGGDDLMVVSPRYSQQGRHSLFAGGAELLAAAAAGAVGMAGVEGGLQAMVAGAAALGAAAAEDGAAGAGAAPLQQPAAAAADASALLEMHGDDGGACSSPCERMVIDEDAAGPGGVFDDAVEITACDLACAEGLPMLLDDGDDASMMPAVAAAPVGAAAPAGGFIRVQHAGGSGLGGALEAVRRPAAVAAASQRQRRGAAAHNDDEEELLQQAGGGLMQLHLAGC